MGRHPMTSQTHSRTILERTLVGSAAVAGAVALVAGNGYGLTAPTGVGSGVVPAVAGVLLLLGALAWTVELVVAGRAAAEQPALATVVAHQVTDSELLDDELEEEPDPMPGRRDVGRVVTVLVAIAATAALLPVLGFSVSMVALLLVLLIGVSRRRPVAAVVVAVVATAAARLVFETWLGTALPTSSLPLLSTWGL